MIVKVNGVQKKIINCLISEREALIKSFNAKQQEIINTLIAISGTEGFNDFDFKEDELILKFTAKTEEVSKIEEVKI